MRSSTIIIGLLLAVLLAGLADAEKRRFKAVLSGEAVRPDPVDTETTGRFRIKFNKEETEARFYLKIKKGVAITQAHLYCDIFSDPIVVFLFGFVPGGFDVDGKAAQFTLTDRNIAALNPVCGINDLKGLRQAMEDGRVYVQAASVANPFGEIRGQVSYDKKDTDGDGIKDKHDPDIDGDGILNAQDVTPYRGGGPVPGPFVGRDILFNYDLAQKLSCAPDAISTPVKCHIGSSQQLSISLSPGWGGKQAVLNLDGTISGSCTGSLIPPFSADNDNYNLVSHCVIGPPPADSVGFFYPAGLELTCNGHPAQETNPPSCPFEDGALTVRLASWCGDATAVLSEDSSNEITGSCSGSVTPDENVENAYRLEPNCLTDADARFICGPKPATGQQLVEEWFTDIPWHQKLSTLHSNTIDIPFVMPFEALSFEELSADNECREVEEDNELLKARCMLRYGIVNIMGMHRTDTLYKSGEVPDGQFCPVTNQETEETDCVQLKLDIQRFHTLTESDQGYAADEVRNNAFPYFEKGKPARVPSLGFAITEATVFAPWRSWYIGHFCGTKSHEIDSVCYDDYFTTQLQATAAPKNEETWLKENPGVFDPPETEIADYFRYCKTGQTSCSMYLGKVDWLKGETEPEVIDCGDDELAICQGEVIAKTKRLDDQFNGAITKFADVGRYPWDEEEKDNLGEAISHNPFIGVYELAFDQVDGNQGNRLFTPPRYVLPKRCTKANYLGARLGSVTDIDALRDCALDFEIHTSGFHEIWKKLYGGTLNEAAVKEILSVLPGSGANQYGRTMFMYAGVPEQKIAVSMSNYENVYGSSMYTQYLPMVNPADNTLFERSYAEDMWHSFFMSNHMNQTPDHFIRGIRGRTLWHNEYRSNIMYDSKDTGKDAGTTFAGKLDHVDFPAGFQVANHKTLFHGNTCDSCHVRNGSGIPLMPNGKLDKAHYEDRGMNEDFVIKRDYTYSNPELPSMKMVLFDLNADSERLEQCDANDHTTGNPLYTNKIMNFYGNSFHVNQNNGKPTYGMKFVPITDDGYEIVDKTIRQPKNMARVYKPQRIEIFGIDTGDRCKDSSDIDPNIPEGVGSDAWPTGCKDVDGDAIAAAITGHKIGFLHLLGKRLGNTPLIEMIPDQAIRDTQLAQTGTEPAKGGITHAGCYGLAPGTRMGKEGGTNYRTCASGFLGNKSTDCYISRWGWMGDRASLEDQIANAANVEMGITSKEGYKAMHSDAQSQRQLVRYGQPLCGPADAGCKAGEANSDITEQEIKDMATYQRWIGIPNRSEYQVSSSIVQQGEKIFTERLRCNSCHVISKIPFVEDDNMLPDEERENLEKLEILADGRPEYPFVSYLGTDLLLHDMGYLSQVARAPAGESIRDEEDGTVKDEYKAYVQRIRTPALKGLRFNRFVTNSNDNTPKPVAHSNPFGPHEKISAAEVIPGCDFLLHDGRACDAIEAAYLHDGPAIKALGTIAELNGLDEDELKALRAFLYSL